MLYIYWSLQSLIEYMDSRWFQNNYW